MNSPPCSVFFHNYYGRHEEWIEYLIRNMQTPFYLFYNIVEDSLYNQDDEEGLPERLNQTGSPLLKKLIIRRSPNQGKDIGGKLVLMDSFLQIQTGSEHIVFLHDKKSPYKTQGREWHDKLFRIIDASFAEKAIQLFAKNQEIGIVAAEHTIKNEFNHDRQSFASNNQTQLTQLKEAFHADISDHRYVAGTMFWARTAPLVDFFKTYPPLDIRRSLENGNMLDELRGTNTHAWERMLSWLIFARGYTIKGI
jgi:lipopolysaccharide biosynthesis protein